MITQRSHIRMTRPSEMSRYLLTMAAITSDPPVDALYCRATPIVTPMMTPPTTQARKVWPANGTCPSNTFWKKPTLKENTVTAKIVRTQNRHPRSFRAAIIKMPLTTA